MQTTFSDLEYAHKKKVTWRDRFLAEIESITPWSALEAEIEAYYPKGGGRGRPPVGLDRMLRMYIAQQCFGLSDEGIEDAIYDSQAMRRFVGIDLSHESAPDATTLLKFRRLLEDNGLTRKIFEAINAHLAEQGLMLREGTIVDATLIAAPPSTKNTEKKRDPAMHQTKKGNHKSRIRARGEHPFHTLKAIFGYRKVRYKGMAKNEAQLFTLFGLGNLYWARRQLLWNRWGGVF
jgi:IS5 family transposase